jgi:hypothetical protein
MMNSDLKRVGFFSEFAQTSEHNDVYPSIYDFLHPNPQDNEALIVNYLRKGDCIAARAGTVGDVINPTLKKQLFAHIYSDGVYCWPLNIAYYVENYHLRLASDFIAHMASSEWRPVCDETYDWEFPSFR